MTGFVTYDDQRNITSVTFQRPARQYIEIDYSLAESMMRGDIHHGDYFVSKRGDLSRKNPLLEVKDEEPLSDGDFILNVVESTQGGVVTWLSSPYSDDFEAQGRVDIIGSVDGLDVSRHTLDISTLKIPTIIDVPSGLDWRLEKKITDTWLRTDITELSLHAHVEDHHEQNKTDLSPRAVKWVSKPPQEPCGLIILSDGNLTLEQHLGGGNCRSEGILAYVSKGDVDEFHVSGFINPDETMDWGIEDDDEIYVAPNYQRLYGIRQNSPIYKPSGEHAITFVRMPNGIFVSNKGDDTPLVTIEYKGKWINVICRDALVISLGEKPSNKDIKVSIPVGWATRWRVGDHNTIDLPTGRISGKHIYKSSTIDGYEFRSRIKDENYTIILVGGPLPRVISKVAVNGVSIDGASGLIDIVEGITPLSNDIGPNNNIPYYEVIHYREPK